MFTYVWDLFTGLLRQRVVLFFFLPLLGTILIVAACVSAARDPSFEHLGRMIVYGVLGLIGLAGLVVLLLAIEWGTGNATRTDPDEAPKGGKPKARPTNQIKRTRREGSIQDWQVNAKVRTARPLLRFLAARDPAFDEERLSKKLADTVGDILEARDDSHLRPVADLLGPALRKAYQAELDRRAADGNRRRFRPVDRVEVRIILLDIPAHPTRHRVTAAVTSRSRDYVVDLDEETLLHGDPDEGVLTQAFWTFLRDGKKWRAEQIRPPEDADDLCSLLNQLSAGWYAAFRPAADPELLNEVSAYPATAEPETLPPPLSERTGGKRPRERAAPVVEQPESPTVRCAFCHQLVLRENFAQHREKHAIDNPV
jgi:predicted lipid-binding transport protein (Tim44 family)